MLTTEDDSAIFQMDRIKRIAGDLANGWEVTFDRESGSDLIHYRICDRFGRVLAVSGYDLQSTMADWSDDDLRQRMRGLLVASFVPSLIAERTLPNSR